MRAEKVTREDGVVFWKVSGIKVKALMRGQNQVIRKEGEEFIFNGCVSADGELPAWVEPLEEYENPAKAEAKAPAKAPAKKNAEPKKAEKKESKGLADLV